VRRTMSLGGQAQGNVTQSSVAALGSPLRLLTCVSTMPPANICSRAHLYHNQAMPKSCDAAPTAAPQNLKWMPPTDDASAFIGCGWNRIRTCRCDLVMQVSGQ
jgi:hypothetical protein